MSSHLIDYSAVRAELRTLSRSNLLVIGGSAAELIPADQLSALLGDIVNLGATALAPVTALIDDTRQFVDGGGWCCSWRSRRRPSSRSTVPLVE